MFRRSWWWSSVLLLVSVESFVSVFPNRRAPAFGLGTFLSAKSNDEKDDELLDDVPGDWLEAGDDEESLEIVDDGDELKVDGDDDEEVSLKVKGALEDDYDDDDVEIEEIDLENEEEDDDVTVEDAFLKKKDGYKTVDSSKLSYDDDTWNEEEDGVEYELEDVPDDPHYLKQRELIDEAIEGAQEREAGRSFNPFDYIEQSMTPEMRATFDKTEFMQRVEARAKDMILTEDDLEGIDVEKELENMPSMDEDPYPRHENDEMNTLLEASGITDDEMIEFEKVLKETRETVAAEPWDKVKVRSAKGFEGVSKETVAEIDEVIENLMEDNGDPSSFLSNNVTDFLLYELDFNVTNLLLASVKHSPDSPLIFEHWYPQLVVYERYQYVRDRDFDFHSDDVNNADVSELERYYKGMGYDEIPEKPPSETGIIGMDYLDEEEIKMAAYESWIKDVYNPEDDKIDFDEEAFRDEDNVFSPFYEKPLHPDIPTFEDAEEDIENWAKTTAVDPDVETEEVRQYRNRLGELKEYTMIHDEEFQEQFRGHLIIACSGEESDLDTAEKITVRFEKEFGKAVYVETRLMALAREEDNVFEIWLESYHIDLLHSKKRATSNAVDWDGPAEFDDEQLDYLTERVRFLISDDSRYSYRSDEVEYAG